MPFKVLTFCAFAAVVPSAVAAQGLPTPEHCAALWQGYGVTTEACRTALAGGTDGAAVPAAVRPAAREGLAQEEGAAPSAPSDPAGADGLTPWMEANHIFFTQGGSSLDDAARERIRLLAQVLETRSLRGSCLRLVGHADTVGSAAGNERLSMQRAETVAQELRRWLSAPERVGAVLGAGEGQSLAGFEPEAPENRRVAIHARDCR
ncbi:OmpA family protein [Pseudoroseicyclus aestuarii]|uniref:Outer membrane protein OmpA-like peptidoglycan-associated protein n=1 Tax=Pseudoroseicyclus aestuarii TaxID=1795041 RepID=A0A318SZY2_9RHOB|nr:OmpA family protein [Pseudoroseicyclus aestuarii]PYE85996.1 outer membrane protein OmpA-like peptidoglycan-associated protein [Pseudoroseicyclus aestuarii]